MLVLVQRRLRGQWEKWVELLVVIKEYYRQLGVHKRLNRTQKFQCRAKDLFERGAYLVFYVESRGCVDWCIRNADLVENNPVV